MNPRLKHSRPTLSRAGLVAGASTMVPLLPGMIAFGIAVGSTAAAKGLTFVENIVMNAMVYAGLSTMVAMEIWPQQITLGAVAGLALAVAIVNARLLLMGAAFRPWFAPLPAWQSYALLQFMTDPTWIAGMRYRSEGGSDIGFYLGGALLIFCVWIVSVAIGYSLGALIPDPKPFALDLVMPVYFAAMLVPLWRGPIRAVPWVVAGVVALLIHQSIGGWWHVIVGSLAGIIVGGFVDDRD